MKKLLIADDNKNIIAILSDYAKKEGYEVITANDGETALHLFENHTIDLILLDVMMPKIDGFEVCKIIRKSSTVAIIMVTAKNEDFDKIMGLDIGADDYIVKPFSPSEVMARVRATLRRVHSDENEIIHYDNLRIDLKKYKVTIDKKQINLTKKEIEILWLLVTNKEKVFTRDNLLDSIWGYDYYGDNRTVDSHIKRLRSKLNALSKQTWKIKTIWGVGYQFEVEKNET
ncbi:MAG: response regulator transcription factor [Breznakia sp.]